MMSRTKLKQKIMKVYNIFIIIMIGFSGILIFEGIMDEERVNATSIYVDSNGGGNYKKIQNAIDNASDGDIIYVWDGIYYENLIINKKLTIIGNGSKTTIINGRNNNCGVVISSNWVNLSGFKIENCGSMYHSYSIRIFNVENITIRDIICSNNIGSGLQLYRAKNIKIFNNTFLSNDYNAMDIYESNKNKIYNNTFLNNYCGIYQESSKFNNFSYNKMVNCGFVFEGDDLEHWITNSVFKNTVNEKILYFWKNLNMRKIPTNAGQIIIVNCSNMTIENQDISNTCNGIQIVYSEKNLIRNNVCNMNNRNGIQIKYSKYNQIEKNICRYNGGQGIKVEYSNNNTFNYNYCTNHHNPEEQYENAGIRLFKSDFNKLENNSCNNNNIGILLERWCINNFVLNNKCKKNNFSGILIGEVLKDSQRNEKRLSVLEKSNYKNIRNLKGSNVIQNNDCTECGSGFGIIFSDGNKVINNDFSNCRTSGSITWSKKNSILMNKCSNNLFTGIGLQDTELNLIKENNITNNRYGLRLSSSSKNCILNNNISFNSNNGITIQYFSNNNIICDNSFIKNSEIGILLKSKSEENHIFNNTFFKNEIGIYFERSISNLIEENTFFNNYGGIYHIKSLNNTIHSNKIVNNLVGIEIQKSFNVTIKENEISFNYYGGIHIKYYSDDIKIYHNHFISNSAYNDDYDYGSNYWNNSRHEGNYWSNYKGVDNGVNGRMFGDYIGDTSLPHLGLDNYPFIKMNGWLYPHIPKLNDLRNIDNDGNYNISWNNSIRSIGFVLEESKNKSFITSSVLYNGSDNCFNITGKNEGTYFYRVKSFNDDYESTWSNIVNVTVLFSKNLPPIINSSFKQIKILEDSNTLGIINLTRWFNDPNDDILDFRIKKTENISVKIFNNGSLLLTPIKDWNGNETLIFYANDSEYEISDKVEIVVLGVNDPPEKPVIYSPFNGTSFYENQKINFNGHCFDVDTVYGDRINYSWTSNISGNLGYGSKLINITLQSGIHKIILWVKDMMNETSQMNIIIEISSLKKVDNINDTTNFKDNNSLLEIWKIIYGLNFSNLDDADLDYDNDNLTNYEEYLNGTNPFAYDTDGDAFSDKVEINNCTNPLDNEDYPEMDITELTKKKPQNKRYMIFVFVGIVIIIFLIIFSIILNKKYMNLSDNQNLKMD
jgi:parallel beta-helix repeat protein